MTKLEKILSICMDALEKEGYKIGVSLGSNYDSTCNIIKGNTMVVLSLEITEEEEE